MISETEFQFNCEKFAKIEGRASFYDLANEILKYHPIQACIIILAVWNVGNFRFIKDREKFLFEFTEAFNKCKPLFNKLEGFKFCSTKFDNIQGTIKEIYNYLSKVKGIGYTGTSKIMHLLNKDLFVMWDSYINGNKQGVEKHYLKLRLSFKKYSTGAEGYINFLEDMQKKFCHIKQGFKGKTLAKCIDENNYVTYTKPIQEIEQKIKLLQKVKKKK